MCAGHMSGARGSETGLTANMASFQVAPTGTASAEDMARFRIELWQKSTEGIMETSDYLALVGGLGKAACFADPSKERKVRAALRTGLSSLALQHGVKVGRSEAVK